MCIDLPKTSFIAMDARHCAGSEMSELMSYAASVGSKAAKKKANKRKGHIKSCFLHTSVFFVGLELIVWRPWSVSYTHLTLPTR